MISIYQTKWKKNINLCKSKISAFGDTFPWCFKNEKRKSGRNCQDL